MQKMHIIEMASKHVKAYLSDFTSLSSIQERGETIFTFIQYHINGIKTTKANFRSFK